MIRRIRNVSLKGKLTAFVVLVALYQGTSLGFWYFRSAREQLYEDLWKKAEALTANLAHNCRPGLLLKDKVDLARFVGSLSRDEDVLYVEVEDAQGVVLASRKGEAAPPDLSIPSRNIRGRSRAGPPKLSLKSFVLPERIEVFEATALVEIEQIHPREEPFTGPATDFLGTVRVGSTTARTLERIGRVMRVTLGFTLVVTLAAAAVCYAVAWTLMRPLGEIARRTRDVARGNFQVSIPEERGDEVGELARAFNQMVADLRRSREGLLRAKEEAEDVIRSAPDALLILDLDGRITGLNPATVRMLGYSGEDLVDQPLDVLLKTEEKEWLRVEDLRELAEKGDLRDLGVTLRARGGEEIPVQASGSILRGEGGRAEGLLAFFRDMRQSRLLADLESTNRDLREAQSRLVQAGKMAALGQMIAGIAHEINNPLTGIVGFAELLLRDRTSPDRLERGLQRILKEATRAKKVVQDLLAFAREHRPRKAVFPLQVPLDRALEPLSDDLAAAKVTLVREFADGLPPVRADMDQLVQVFTNILTNAMHALDEVPEEHRRLDVRTESGQGIVRAKICDTGPGIPPAILEKIFEPFFTTRDVGKGTGLGLSISHSMIRSHGGSLTAHSEPGRGATFVVELPASVEPTDGAKPAGGSGEKLILDLGVHGRKVLVVEREEGVVALVTEIFRSSGNRTETAGSLDAALTAIRGSDYDLILCGTEQGGGVVNRVWDEAVRLNPELRGRFVFLHGGAGDPELDAFLKTTGQVCLYKPFTVRELVIVAKQILGTPVTA